MATTKLVCPINTWTRINIVSKIGQMQLYKGHVFFTQQSVDPRTFNVRVPLNGGLRPGEERTYDTTSEPNEFVWAFGIEDSEIDITPVGGTL